MNLHALSLPLFACALFAQDSQARDSKKPQSAPSQDSKAVIETFLASDGKDRSACDKLVRTLLMDPKSIEVLAGFLPKEGAKPEPGTEKRAKAFEMLFQTYLRDYLRAQTSTGMVYDGQYSRLKALMPQAGKVYLKFLLETPDWVPEGLRVPTVAALRDLYPKVPSEDDLNNVRKVAKDIDFEGEELRNAAAFALAQWGDRELVEKQIATLRKTMETGKEDEQLDAQKKLSDVYYQLREYDRSAGEWREWIAKSEKGGKLIRPNDLYNAACNFSLAGDVDGSLATIEKCLKLQNSGSVDVSLHVNELLFRRDPDLNNARKNARFAELVNAGFGKGGAKNDADAKKEPEAKPAKEPAK